MFTSFEEYNDFSVLILEDSHTTTEMYRKFFDSINVGSVYSASTIEKARDIVDKHEVDCVVVDLNLGESINGGFKVAEFFDPVKCVIASGHINEDAVRQANILGFTNILVKPFEMTTLGSAVSKIYWSSGRKCRMILDGITEFICRWKPDGTLVFVNRPFCDFFRKECSEIIGRNIRDFIIDEQQGKFQNFLDKFTRENSIHKSTFEVKTINGQHWCRCVTKATFGKHNEILGFQTTGRDYTDNYKTQQMIQRAEQKYRNLFENAPDAIEIVELDGTIVSCNNMDEQLLGYSKYEIIGQNVMRFITRPSIEILKSKLEEVKKFGSSECEIEVITKSGKIIPVWHRGRILVDNETNTLRILCYIRDLSNLRQVQNELTNAQKLFYDLFNNLPDSIAVLNLDHTIRRVNAEMERLLGSEDTLIGHTCFEIFHDDDKICEECPVCKPNFATAKNSALIRCSNDNESPIWKEYNHYPLFDANNNELIGYIIHVHDITCLKKKEIHLQYRLDIETLVALISSSFVGISIDQIDIEIKRSLRKIVEFSNVDRSYVYLLEDKHFVCTHFWRTDETWIESPFCIIHSSDMVWLYDKLMGGDYFQIDNVNDLQNNSLRNLFQTAKAISVLIVPLINPDNGETIGFIGLDTFNKSFDWTEDIRILLGIVAEIFANAITRKENEERYRELYTLMRLMCDNIPDLIWAKDLESKYLFANKSMCVKLLECCDPDEAKGKTDVEFANKTRSLGIEHTFGEMCEDSDKVIIQTQKPGRFFEDGNSKGQYLALDVYKAPFLDENGRMIGTVGCGRDITKEKEMENKVRDLEMELEETREQSGVKIVEAIKEWTEQNTVLSEVINETTAKIEESTSKVNQALNHLSKRGVFGWLRSNKE